jgi:diguanylate cyclase (GGDEF)-like protein/PAS domain S-box-containing protein
MLQYAQANLSALIESAQDMIWSVGLDYRLISFNPAVQQYIQNNYGARLAEGMCFHEVLPPEQAELWPVFYERVLAEGAFRIECTRADGRFMELAFDPIAVDGDITGISIIGKDITQRKAAEDALHEAGEKYRNIFDGALEGIFQTTLEGRVLAANPAVAGMLGYDSPEDFIASVKDIAFDVWAFPNERAWYLQLLEETEELRGYEVQFKRKDGTRIWVKLSTRKTYAADGVTPINEGFIEDITEQKKSESALKKAEANLSALIESTQDLIWSVDLDYRLITFNRALQQNIQKNYGVRLAAGMRFHEVLTPEHAALWPGHYARVLAEGPFQVEYTRVDGGIMELAFNPIAVDGVTTGVSIFGKEITERKAAEESRLFLAEVVESCEEAIITSTPSGVILSWNHGAEAIYGYSAGEVIGKPFSMIIAPERKESAARIIGKILRGAPPLEDQGVGLRKDGSKVYVTVTAWPIRNSAGEATAICTIVRNVSARHEAEKTRALLASIVESSGDAVHAVNLDGTIASWNSGAERLTGYTSEEILGKSVAILAPSGIQSEARHNLEAIQDGRTVGPYDVALLRKDGSEIDVSLTLSPIRNSDGEVVGAAAIARDISQRKRTEMQLRESEERYRTTFEQAAVGIVHTSIEGQYLRCNARFAEIIGYPQEEVSGLSFQQITVAEDLESDDVSLHNLQGGAAEIPSMEKRYVRKDGSLVWVRVTLSSQRDGEGKILYFIAIVEDIQERKEAEAALRESLDSLQESQAIGGLGSYVLDIGTGVWTSSDVLDGLFGIDREYDHTVTGWTVLIHPDDRAMMAAYFAKEVIRKGSNFNKEYRMIRQTDHAERWVHGIGRLQFGVKGQPVKMRGVIKDITESKLSEMQLRESEKRYRAAFQMNLDSIDICHLEDGKFVDVNEAFLKILGFKRDEVIGRTALELGIWANPADREKLLEGMRRNSVLRNFETQYRTKDGALRWGLLSVSAIEMNGVPCILSVTRDITDAKAVAEALRLSEERYRTVFQTSIDAIIISRVDDGSFIDCNQAFVDMSGYQRNEVLGRTSLELGIWPDTRDRQTMMNMLRQDSSICGLEVQLRRKDGEIGWRQISASVIEIDGVPCILSITRDISAAKKAEKTIQSLAFYDPLTGLPNRRMLMERLRHPLAASARSDHSHALLLVDLDHFKTLNDTLGHQTGDFMLQKSAQRIIACTHEADTVCRLGGDEFVVVLEDLSIVAEEAADQAKAVGEKILAVIDQPCLLDNHECHSTASIGIAVFGVLQDSTDETLQQAEIALYQAKAAGRNTLRFFSPALQAAVNARATLEGDLRQAIKTKQFLLYYQPQVERGHVTGAEALIRWKHPGRGIVSPGEFIPLAEESRLILPLGEWVLEAACAQIASWEGSKETAHLTVAVNISALQFRQPSFVEQVLATLSRTGANHGNLRLELTESMLVENIENVIAKMNELKSHGLRFSLDDFGTGYSSLSYLKRLPLDSLKIDRSFVHDILVDATSGAITQTILSLGRAMGVAVIAEGVETEEQRDYLASLGCHSFQGFLFSRPLPLKQFEAFLRGFAENGSPC